MTSLVPRFLRHNPQPRVAKLPNQGKYFPISSPNRAVYSFIPNPMSHKQEQAQQHDKHGRPFSRLQATTGGDDSVRFTQSSDNEEGEEGEEAKK